MLLRRDRKSDDNLQHRLNVINAGNYEECMEVARWLSEMHRARRQAIGNCINILRQHDQADDVYRKEMVLLGGEQVVEDIVEQQSWSLLKDRCRILGDVIDEFKKS